MNGNEIQIIIDGKVTKTIKMDEADVDPIRGRRKTKSKKKIK